MTVISSRSKTVTFGQGLPTVIVGERINPTGRKSFGEALLAGDLSLVQREAIEQVQLGADILDVNVGIAGIDEVEMLPKAVKAVMEVVDVPLCIDSSNPDALAAALKVYEGKPLVNSVTGEEASIARILPVIKAHGAAVVGLCMDDNGIPADVEGRVAIAKKIAAAAKEAGIPREDLVFDMLTMSVGTDPQAAMVTLAAVRQVAREGYSTILGASNVSFGLPDRRCINLAFLTLAVQAGLSAAIADPKVKDLSRIIRAVDLLTGLDEWGMRYLEHYRALEKES
ncbi:MAG: dihydropteroate synthase [Bacillota bacterium]